MTRSCAESSRSSFRYQPNRGHVYHLHAKSLYRALAQRDNRNRRQVSPAVIARKLMVLDYVLTVPDAEWYATEEDKVALFTRELGIPIGDLPQRVYEPHGPRPRRDDAAFHSQAAGLSHGRSGRRPLRVSRERRDRPRVRAVSSGPRAAVQRVAGVVRRGGLPTRA